MDLSGISTKFLGKKIQYFEAITSTQEYVKEQEKLLNLIEGEIIFAERQILGVGTHQRKWFTGKENNLAFSFVLYPNCNISKLDRLTRVIAESMVQAIKQMYLIRLDIKEPNDIMYKNKKMGGILTESITEGEQVKKVFIGIGFNVNQEKFPGNLGDIATSLKKEFKTEFPRKEILIRFLEIFEEKYLSLIK